MKNIVLTLLFLLLVLPFSAANHNLTKIDVTNLNVNSGLASNEVTCILALPMDCVDMTDTNLKLTVQIICLRLFSFLIIFYS